MSAIKFTLVVCDAPQNLAEGLALRMRSDREVTVVALNYNDAKDTYLSHCPRDQVEVIAMKDASVASFEDLDMTDRYPSDYLVSEKVARSAFIEEMEPFPANCNPFRYDAFSMGSDLVRGWMAMHEGFDRKESPFPLNWLYLVNTRTGRRVRIHLNDVVVEQGEEA
jgi:hypothetical protein